MAEGTQHALKRVRPPRVQVTYDVETGGAIEKKELPFIVGVMADLAGQTVKTLNRWQSVLSRKLTEITLRRVWRPLVHPFPWLFRTS